MTMPTVWMNVTTSEAWNRPPVGIVRCEMEIAKGLEQLLTHGQFKKCVWAGDRFVPLRTDAESPVVSKDEAAPAAKSKSFEMMFPIISRKQSIKNIAQAMISIAPSVMRPAINRILFRMKPAAKWMFFKAKSMKRRISAIRSYHSNISQTKKISIENQRENHNQSEDGRSQIFRSGDVLVSIGLDWDYPYNPTLIKMHSEGIKIITCCYDLIPILYPQFCLTEVTGRFASYFIDLAEASNTILCISKQTQNDLRRFLYNTGANLPDTEVIRLGDNVVTGSGNISNEVRSAVAQRFILYVSSIERRKNHETIYKAIHILCENGKKEQVPKIIFVGMPGWFVNETLNDIKLDPAIKDKIVILNHVSDTDLAYLYRKALFCLYPSIYEGWGLPVAEALALGKFVISSDRGSLPEVGGDLVEYAPTWNPYAWAEKIFEYSTNDGLLKEKEQRIKKEYKKAEWIDTAQTVRSVINRMTQ